MPDQSDPCEPHAECAPQTAVLGPKMKRTSRKYLILTILLGIVGAIIEVTDVR